MDKNEWLIDYQTSFKSKCVNDIGGDDAHRDADIEGDGAEEVDVGVDVLVEVVSADRGDGGIADPEGVVGEVEQGDREEDHPADTVDFIPEMRVLGATKKWVYFCQLFAPFYSRPALNP